ncbi:uncharacterized protein LOC129001266 [Macrosteles quadrilineatus]|uniref:uncharacterized protein LOC129001266 n=1 Tax=Macrosteles quadrilineatus TaxID=74068 RepID=UPI0023E16FF2|nr:uncharacterized protein LOC129001266 [Macrosteles quadrilineatus]
MTPLHLLVVLLLASVEAQLNPLGRFGKCIDVKAKDVNEADLEGTWYLQYRPENPDHYVHTCQAQYDHETKDGILHSLLYFYNKGKSVNEPQHIKYQKIKPGVYKRGITVDEAAVYIKLYVLDFDTEKNSRVLYYCTDSNSANPDIFNVQIATRDQIPTNLKEVFAAGESKLQEASSKFKVPLMKVEQSTAKCAPLIVEKGAMDKYLG